MQRGGCFTAFPVWLLLSKRKQRLSDWPKHCTDLLENRAPWPRSIRFCWLVLGSPFSLSLQNWSLYSQHTFKLVEGNAFDFLQNTKKCLTEPSLLRGIKGVKQEDPSYESSWKSTLTLEDRFLTLSCSTYIKFRQLPWMEQWKFRVFFLPVFFSMIIFCREVNTS